MSNPAHGSALVLRDVVLGRPKWAMRAAFLACMAGKEVRGNLWAHYPARHDYNSFRDRFAECQFQGRGHVAFPIDQEHSRLPPRIWPPARSIS